MFDLGGVVIGIDFGRAFRSWARDARCDPAAITTQFRMDDAYERHERGELDAVGYFACLRKSLGIDLSDEDFLCGWNDIYLDPVEGIEQLLREASHRFPLYGFTNSNPSHREIWSVLIQRELTYFRSIFLSSDLGIRKPEPRAFSLIASITERPTSSFLFFDDTAENVIGAKEAGMQALLVRSLDDVRDALGDLGVDIT